MNTQKKYCVKDKCGQATVAKSLCQKHYKRLKRYGRLDNIIPHIRHGGSNTPEYRAWRAMLDRCNRQNHEAYSNYGGRGITVHEDFNNFESFINYIGKRPNNGYSLDRIDNDGNYEPGNVRWATALTQSNNTRANGDRVYFKWQSDKERWYVRKKINGKVVHVGFFKRRIDAIPILQKMCL